MKGQPPPDPRPLPSIAEAAARLGVGKRTPSRIIASGQLPVARLSRKMVRIRPAALEAFVEQHTIKPEGQ